MLVEKPALKERNVKLFLANSLCSAPIEPLMLLDATEKTRREKMKPYSDLGVQQNLQGQNQWT